MPEAYTYRGIYDEGERGRIESLLADQRSMFISSEKQSFDLQEKFKQYGVIALGAVAILIIVKLISK